MRMRSSFVLSVWLFAVVSSASFALAANGGTLDPTFGVRVVTFPSPSDGAAVAIQPDGLVVAVGHSGTSPSSIAVARFLTDGTKDASFGGGDGRVTTVVASGAVATGVVIQPDGRIVVAGTAESAPSGGVGQVTLVRYDGADGALDMGFGTNGVVVTPPVTDAEVAALALQPDGRLVVVGTDDGKIMVRRYDADGSADGTFGTGGLVTTAIGTSARGLAVVLEPGGAIVVAGGATVAPGDEDFALVRYASDGTLDATFGGGGIVTTTMAGTSEAAVALVRDPTGRLVAAGATGGTFPPHFMLIRYDGAGALDPSFGSGGIMVDTSVPGQPRALALQGDGKLVAAGVQLSAIGPWIFGYAHLARYDDTGAPDPSFGMNGEVASQWDDHSEVFAIALHSDGRIVVAGQVGDLASAGHGFLFVTNLRMTVARYFAGVCGDANQEPGESCDDGNVAAGDCCSPACDLDAAGTACDDGQPGDLCTVPDACDGAGGCVGGLPVQCPPCEACNLMTGCEAVILPMCKTPVASGAASLALTNSTSPAKNRVQWKWSKGAATAVGDFGAPDSSDDYDLCIFDSTSALVMSAGLPAGGSCGGKPCWKPVSKGFRYHDRDATPDGITGALLKAGDAGKAKVSVDGKGGNVVPPNLSMLSLPLRVQLQAENGQCWEATYSSSGVTKNDGERFKARSN